MQEPAVAVVGEDVVRSGKDGDSGIAGNFAVVDLPLSVAGIFELRSSGGGLALIAHNSDVFSRNTILFGDDRIEGVERFGYGNTAFVSVVDAGTDVDIDASCVGKSEER